MLQNASFIFINTKSCSKIWLCLRNRDKNGLFLDKITFKNENKMEFSMSQLPELIGLGVPVFIGCSFVMGNGDNLQGCPGNREISLKEEPAWVAKGRQEELKLPDELNTPEAIEILNKLQEHDYLDDCYQPKRMSISEKGVLASLISDKLGINQPWVTFGELWNMNKETLRKGNSKGMDQKSIERFIEKIKDVMD